MLWFDVDVSYESYVVGCCVCSSLYLSADVSCGGVVFCGYIDDVVGVPVGFCEFFSVGGCLPYVGV